MVFDVDGVLTDGTIYVGKDGESLKAFNVKDGLAISLLKAHGIKTGILSGKKSEPLEYRVSQLGFDYSILGETNKLPAINRISVAAGIQLQEIAYVGDDVIDLPLLGVVGRFFTPNDAHKLLLQSGAENVGVRGGHGVAREVAEIVLSASGLSLGEMYEPFLKNSEGIDVQQ